jgi:pantoate--beta-alanine ligase
MKRATSVNKLQEHLSGMNLSPSGFVPTMGALHKGHISLVNKAIDDCNILIVSIFVNPNQFNDKEDLKNYPRTIEKDLDMLSEILRENDIVFIPETEEIYPEPDTRIFDFGNLDKVMEGLYRPGHFNGVAQVVSRLFDIVKPDLAYFGQKDFQQLTIIRELANRAGNRVRIISCPIVREADGLAMSSRNLLLEPHIRKEAGIIYNTISKAAELIKTMEINNIKKYVNNNINLIAGFNVEYFEIADDKELMTIAKKSQMKRDKKYFACIAVNAGKIRLIDNVEIRLL